MANLSREAAKESLLAMAELAAAEHESAVKERAEALKELVTCPHFNTVVKTLRMNPEMMAGELCDEFDAVKEANPPEDELEMGEDSDL